MTYRKWLTIMGIIREWVAILAKNILWELYEKKQYERNSQLGRISNNEINNSILKIYRDEYAGLFSYVEICMRYIAYASKNNMTPMVDMTGCINPYLEEKDWNTKNWWELYFEQPAHFNIGLHPTIINCVDVDLHGEVPHSRYAVMLKKSRWYWGRIYAEYFRLNTQSSMYFQKEYEELFQNGKLRVLGVLIRGTDYRNALGHPVQPSYEQIEKYVKKYEKKYEKIYVASDEYHNVERLKKKYGNKVIVNKRVYFDKVDMSGKSINEVGFDRKDDKYLKGIEYLSSIMLLSKCGGLVAGICGGSVAAVYLNNGRYEDLKLFYLGLLT